MSAHLHGGAARSDGPGEKHHVLSAGRAELTTSCLSKHARTRVHGVLQSASAFQFIVCLFFFLMVLVDCSGSVSAPPSSSTHRWNNQLFIQRQNKWLSGNSMLFIVFTACCVTPVKNGWILGGKRTRCQSATVKTKWCVALCKAIRLMGLQQDVLTWLTCRNAPSCRHKIGWLDVCGRALKRGCNRAKNFRWNFPWS